ncbi:MAG TPA: FtsW/RodA/SpoVE family cell cycle protein, partial [Oscillospiraceae bacterium]|nr:FtsW/RodA/SpoVE family cell cycle protein [Oscillospiraceae bacterium]
IQSWRDPFSDTTGNTWQTQQSLIAIGSGGLFGLGLGNSRQKYLYLPESENDFVFAIVCEELGFIGAMLVILLFMAFIFRGFYIASKAPDKFGMMLAVGLTVQIGLQALLNIAVVTNTIPNTGISLPFFSYGGTALTMQLIEMGIILNISRQSLLET